MKPPPLHWTEPIEGDVLKFHYRVIEVADFLAEDILRRGEISLLALLPLTIGGATRENVEIMLGELNTKENEDLALAGFTLALAIFDRSQSESGLADREWIIERYNNMYSMLHDLLHVDPMYEAIVQVGEEKERRERILALQRIALSIIAARFPQLEQVARTRIAAVVSVGQLEQLVVTLGSVCDEKDAYEALSACKPDEPVD